MNNIANMLSNIANDDTKQILEKLSKYTEKIINEDKSIIYKEISTTYFLKNNIWNVDFFSNLEQFQRESEKSYQNIYFTFNNENINKEMKFIVYNKIFSDEWKLSSAFNYFSTHIKLLAKFINEIYKEINSFKELNIEKATIQWIDWLKNNNFKVTREYFDTNGQKLTLNNSRVNFLKFIVNLFYKLTWKQDEWEKDRWDVRNLTSYGISYNKSRQDYYIDFSLIDNLNMRREIKKYIKQRLLAKNQFSSSTAILYVLHIRRFINFISKLEPTWKDLKKLERHNILAYLKWLDKTNKKNCNKYIRDTIKTVQKFLFDIQMRESDIAPEKNIRILIFPDDKPMYDKKPYDQIDYVPDCVLEQLFEHINNLHKEVIPVIYIMFKTGLRISDALGLTTDCLVKLNDKYWITTDIEKVYVKGHKIPIDNELADMISALIDKSKCHSNQDNNPEHFIFVRFTGSRKGKPYSQQWVRNKLNLLSAKFNITDEKGNNYHFKNHAFRHTYAIKMLNGGADILTVQELLAHASPEMTMRYAKLLDDTKRKTFDKAVKQGIFSFNEGDKLKEENNGEIPKNILDMLYTNHKLNALDTPYGTCMQRKNGKCSFAKQPPCLTCNNGNPCKDLCVGAFEGDINKYEILINSTKTMIENAKIYNRIEMINENEELLKLYEDIYSKISQGNLIYSRIDKLKRKGDVHE